MTPHQLRATLQRLGLTAGAFARALDVNDRTVRRWQDGDVVIPRAIVLLLDAWEADAQLFCRQTQIPD